MNDIIIKDIIKKYDLMHKSREQEYMFKRHYFCYFLRTLGYTFEEIGRILNKNHATIINSVKMANDLMEYKDDKFSRVVYKLEHELNEVDLVPVWKLNTEKKESVFLTLINRLFEARDMADIEALKSFANENINPDYLKK